MKFNFNAKIGDSKISVNVDKTEDDTKVVDVDLNINLPEEISTAIKNEILRKILKMPIIIFNGKNKKREIVSEEYDINNKEDKNSILKTFKRIIDTIDTVNDKKVNIPDPRNR